MAPTKKVKGLDSFSKRFLTGDAPSKEPKVETQAGWKADSALIEKYQEDRKLEFITRAGDFTMDLLGFFKQQKDMRKLSDTEAVFAIALFAINLRESFGTPQNEEEAKSFTEAKRQELLKVFDTISYGAQQYYDENKNDS